jgi:1,4-alpha-glucan branching enzyme
MIEKKIIKSRQVCKVKFNIPKSELPAGLNVEEIALLGDFNNWDGQAHPLKRLRNGSYQVMVEFDPGQEIHFRYLANGKHWFNAWGADAYQSNGSGADNCVLLVP